MYKLLIEYYCKFKMFDIFIVSKVFIKIKKNKLR